MSEPVWIEEELVLAIHDRQLAEHGGAEGVRDLPLPRWALVERQNHRAYDNSDIVQLAGKYIAGIVQNHLFVDGNKRTGFLVGVLFLELNRGRFIASEDAAAQMILQLAAGNIDETGLISFQRGNVEL
jgi:death-on-curing protein